MLESNRVQIYLILERLWDIVINRMYICYPINQLERAFILIKTVLMLRLNLKIKTNLENVLTVRIWKSDKCSWYTFVLSGGLIMLIILFIIRKIYFLADHIHYLSSWGRVTLILTCHFSPQPISMKNFCYHTYQKPTEQL